MASGRRTGIGFRRLRRLAVIACVLVVGCRESPKPDAPDAVLSPDEVVLNTLEPYDPIYKLNYNGRVVELKLEGRRIPPAVLDEVGKLTELTALSLYAAAITDDDLAKLQTLKNLQGLGLGATLITDRGLVHLEKLSTLKWVWLSKELVPSPGVDALQTAIPGLTVFPQ